MGEQKGEITRSPSLSLVQDCVSARARTDFRSVPGQTTQHHSTTLQNNRNLILFAVEAYAALKN